MLDVEGEDKGICRGGGGTGVGMPLWVGDCWWYCILLGAGYTWEGTKVNAVGGCGLLLLLSEENWDGSVNVVWIGGAGCGLCAFLGGSFRLELGLGTGKRSTVHTSPRT